VSARIRRGACVAAALIATLFSNGSAAASAPAVRSPPVPPVRAPAASPQVFHYPRFGAISVYRGAGEPEDFVLFLSGDGGWSLGVVSMARHLAAQGAIVAGIDIRHYLKELGRSSAACVSPAVDFENLSHFLQARLGLKRYLQPTLVGYSSGATLVYATLVQSPEGLFKGALSIGFCPDLDLKKPLCRGSGIESVPRRNAKGVRQGVNFLPAKKLPGAWISLQGEIDQVCPAPATKKFIAAVPAAEIVNLPKVGHGYGIEKNWMPQFEAAYRRITASTGPSAQSPPSDPVPTASASAAATPAAAPADAQVADLPLNLVPAAAGATSPWFGVFLSGDGGWVGIDRDVSKALAEHGIPVVGWDSLKYFWSARTPDGAARDLDRVLRHYGKLWGKSRALLVGYSQGADTLPFMVNRLPPETRAVIGFTALLGLSDRADFEFHFANWLGDSRRGIPTAPELARWSGSPYLCLYGADDRESTCAKLAGTDAIVVKMPGGHHFDGSYGAIAKEILARLPSH